MDFRTATNRQKKLIYSLVGKISKELHIEESIILHFLYIDLERIYNDKIKFHTAKLVSTEEEFKELNKHEKELKLLIEKRIFEMDATKKVIDSMASTINEKEANLATLKIKLNELKNTSSSLNQNISELEKDRKKFEFKIMMNKHAIKEKSDVSFKFLGWLLTLFTIIAVIIAILIIKSR